MTPLGESHVFTYMFVRKTSSLRHRKAYPLVFSSLRDDVENGHDASFCVIALWDTVAKFATA